jgi:4-amino-4-deoxychorismate lyase
MIKHIELLETIKIEAGRVENINWHNQRCNRSRKSLFSSQNEIDLLEYIRPPQEGLFRCRILYSQDINSVEYIPYSYKKITTIKVIKSQIEYPYKYSNRDELNALLLPEYDEIIIEKNGLITDTSIANIALYQDNKWITPQTPLLEGTLRAKLLENNFLHEKEIRKEELQNFSHFALMNAMIGFQIQKNITIDV